MMYLEYIFYRVYHFYHKRWPLKDPEVYAMCFVAIWIYFNLLFLFLLLQNAIGQQWLLTGTEKLWLVLPFLLLLGISYRYFIGGDRFRQINLNKQYSELTASGKGKRIIISVIIIPVLIITITLLTKPR